MSPSAVDRPSRAPGAAKSSTWSSAAAHRSREIVRAHGGSIWVDSGHGPASVFSFTLPIADAEEAPAPVGKSPEAVVREAARET